MKDPSFLSTVVHDFSRRSFRMWRKATFLSVSTSSGNLHLPQLLFSFQSSSSLRPRRTWLQSGVMRGHFHSLTCNEMIYTVFSFERFFLTSLFTFARPGRWRELRTAILFRRADTWQTTKTLSNKTASNAGPSDGEREGNKILFCTRFMVPNLTLPSHFTGLCSGLASCENTDPSLGPIGNFYQNGHFHKDTSLPISIF